ncbi:MAG: hypothetical protein ACO1O6_11090 [Bacteroidota bacterium]
MKTISIENYKNFDREIELIRFITSLDNTNIELNDNPQKKAKISKIGKELFLDINDRSLFNEFGLNKRNIEVRINNKDFILDLIHYSSAGLNASEKGGVSFSCLFDVNILKTPKFNQYLTSRFRCFFPVETDKLKSFYHILQTVTYNDFFYNCIRLTIENSTIDVTILENNHANYYIIESINSIPYDEFIKNCFAVQQTLGFLLGYMPGGENYLFSDELDVFYSNHMRPEIDAMYIPVQTNPYSRIFQNEIAEKYRDKLTLIGPEVTSSLATKIKHSQELSSTIILLLESSSVRSLLLIPSVFAVVIESLSKIISIAEQGKHSPVTDKELSKRIIEKLNSAIDLFASELDAKSLLKLKRRINELNRPVVKNNLTNNEKLTQPFEQLNITLTMDDVEAIEHRNDLLHGNILLNNTDRDSHDANSNMAYVSARLYTLISKLILKYAGYQGYIINHARFYEELIDKETGEDHYCLI